MVLYHNANFCKPAPYGPTLVRRTDSM